MRFSREPNPGRNPLRPTSKGKPNRCKTLFFVLASLLVLLKPWKLNHVSKEHGELMCCGEALRTWSIKKTPLASVGFKTGPLWVGRPSYLNQTRGFAVESSLLCAPFWTTTTMKLTGWAIMQILNAISCKCSFRDGLWRLPREWDSDEIVEKSAQKYSENIWRSIRSCWTSITLTPLLTNLQQLCTVWNAQLSANDSSHFKHSNPLCKQAYPLFPALFVARFQTILSILHKSKTLFLP